MSEKNVVVLQHIECEPAGRVDTYLKRIGACVQYVKVHRGERISMTSGMDALLVLGGPMGVYEEKKYPFISKELRLLENALSHEVPVLGICLGSQLLAKAAGGSVFPGGKKEIGWYPVTITQNGAEDRIFSGFPKKLTAFHWHGDTFSLPKSCTHLASSKLFPMQAFRAGENAYGLQFHVEVTAPMIKEWVKLYKSDRTEQKAKAVLSGIKNNIKPLNEIAFQLCKNFFGNGIASLRSQ